MDAKGWQKARGYQPSEMQRELIIQRLKEKGCRITRKRLLVLDIILQQECSCCKEIYYEASKRDAGIGAATVYRMLNILEEIGAINRKNMYRVAYSESCFMEDAVTVVLDDDTICNLSSGTWNQVIREGLKSLGYLKEQGIVSVQVAECQDGSQYVLNADRRRK